MKHLMRTLLLGAVTAGALVLANPAQSQADDDDDYWTGYWSWYDGTYRPYYHRQYQRYRPRYDYDGGYYDSRYGGRYYDGYYGGGYYDGPRYRYGGNYYGTPNYGYRDYRGSGGQVRVGPLRFGWR